MITLSNITQANGSYTATVDIDGNISTMTFATDPSVFSQAQLQQMHDQVVAVKLANLPSYIQQLAVEIVKPAYTGMTDDQLVAALNTASITTYPPVPSGMLMMELIELGVYPRLKDASVDTTNPDHAPAVDLLALMAQFPTLDFSEPDAMMLFNSFKSVCTASDIAAVQAFGIQMVNWPTSIGYSGSITLSDISQARGN